MASLSWLWFCAAPWRTKLSSWQWELMCAALWWSCCLRSLKRQDGWEFEVTFRGRRKWFQILSSKAMDFKMCFKLTVHLNHSCWLFKCSEKQNPCQLYQYLSHAASCIVAFTNIQTPPISTEVSDRHSNEGNIVIKTNIRMYKRKLWIFLEPLLWKFMGYMAVNFGLIWNCLTFALLLRKLQNWIRAATRDYFNNSWVCEKMWNKAFKAKCSGCLCCPTIQTRNVFNLLSYMMKKKLWILTFKKLKPEKVWGKQILDYQIVANQYCSLVDWLFQVYTGWYLCHKTVGFSLDVLVLINTERLWAAVIWSLLVQQELRKKIWFIAAEHSHFSFILL